MDVRILEKVLLEQKLDLERNIKTNFCHRNEEQLVNLDSPLAQVVMGIRRSGKTTLCYNVLKTSEKKFAYINFDDERLSDFSKEDLDVALEVLYKVYGNVTLFFFDEIQNVSEWFLFINRLLRNGVHILLTGSNSKLLKGDLADHLTGRHSQIELYPFSFSEYCDYLGLDATFNTTKQIGLLRSAFDNYLRNGGFPETYLFKREIEKKEYINSLTESIIKNDIIRRHKIRFVSSISELANHLMNIAPTAPSIAELQEIVGINSPHTIENYIEFLNEAYLLFGVRKYSVKSKLRIHNEKYYVVDVSLMNRRKDSMLGENLGWRLETVVGVELKRRTNYLKYDLFYYGDRTSESDFVVMDGRTPLAIYQVCYDISKEKTLKREIKGLLNASRALNCDNLFLLTDNEYKDITEEKFTIKIRPVYQWVLDNKQ